MHALIFDLDDTLIIDEVAETTAILKTCLYAQIHYQMNLPGFQTAIRKISQAAWQQSPGAEFCVAAGIPALEGLWARFTGAGRHLSILRDWAPHYRLSCWQLTLERFGIDDKAFASRLADHFMACRAGLQILFHDVEANLAYLRKYYRLGLLTNGTPDLQWMKIKETGLEKYFDAVVISGEFGVGKPDPRIFEWILSMLDVSAQDTLMIGNNLHSDIAGAKTAGIPAAWLNRLDESPAGSMKADIVLHDLYQLRGLLDQAGSFIPGNYSVVR
jgi:putative hydrolase of the HAD superfamily